MAIDFPASPTANQTFTVGSITYKWDGTKWIGLGVTPADRLVEGSNSLEINANNDLVWTGDSVLLGTATANVNDRLTIHDPGSAFMSIRSDVASDGNSQVLDFGVGTADRSSSNLTAVIAADIHSTSGGTLKADLVFQTNAGNNISDKLRLTSDGVLQVGSSATINVKLSPNTGLEINDGAINSYQATTNVNATPFKIRSDVGGTGVEKLSIKADGDIVIGGTDVATGLQGIKMYLGSNDPSLVGCKADNNPGAFVTLLKLAGYSQSGTDFRENAAILFETDAANSAGSASGRILLRTENAGSDNGPSTRVQIDDEGIFFNYSENHGIYTETSVGAGTVKYLYRGANTSGSNIVFNVWSNGDVESATNSFGSVSDVKLKENIVDAGSQWADIKLVKFRKFNFKEETGYQTHTQLGVIAQELEAISPGLVYETPDLDRDGNDLGTTTKKVKASVLTMKAMVALQEAMARIEELEARLEAAGI